MQNIKKKSLEIKKLYNKLNELKGEKKWDSESYLQGLVGDVGDLVKLHMSHKGLRNSERDIKSIKDGIKHELVDCLWSLLIISQELDIDLEKETIEQLDILETNVTNKINELKK